MKKIRYQYSMRNIREANMSLGQCSSIHSLLLGGECRHTVVPPALRTDTPWNGLCPKCC